MLVKNVIDFAEGKLLLSNFVNSINQHIENHKSQPKSYSGIVQTRDLVKDFLINSPPFAFFNLRNRPILGYKVKDILEHQEGQCGEASRLLYHIFREQGIESRRVYLYGINKQHVILETRVKDKWIILDTDNSPEDFYVITTAQRFSIDDLFLRNSKYGITKPTQSNYFYSEYSYFNVAKLFGPLGLAVFVHEPILVLAIYLYETPSLWYMILNVFLFIISSLILIYVIRYHKKGNRDQRNENIVV